MRVVHRAAVVVAAVAAGGYAAGQGAQVSGKADVQVKVNADRLVRANDAFGVALLRKVEPQETGNVLISPFSLSSNLSLLLAGSQGQTRHDLATTLGIQPISNFDLLAQTKSLGESLDKTAGSSVHVANSLWLAPGFMVKPSYRSIATIDFRASIHVLKALGAEGAKDVNDWVDKTTKGRIPTLVGPLEPLTTLLLLNAVTFDGKWVVPFSPDLTHPKDFHGAAGTKQVPTMSRFGRMAYTTSGETQILKLPYQTQTSMFIALPPAGTDPLKAVEALQNTVETHDESVDLWLPKFTFEDKHSLNAPLSAMGMESVFKKTNLRGIADDSRLDHVSEVMQKTYVKVDEIGTEAAAATSTIVSARAIIVHPQNVDFHVDRPFAFAIKDDATGLILFLGIVRNLG